MWNAELRGGIKPTAGPLVLSGLTWAGASYNLSTHPSLEQVRSLVQSLGAYGAVAFVGLCVGAVLLHIPEILLIAIGGVLFGSVKGFLLGWMGSVAGSTCSFLIARYFMRNAVQRFVLFMAPPLNWAIGVTRVRLRDYDLGSALGVVPFIAVTSYAANTVAQAGSLSALLTPDTLLPATLAFIVVTVGALVAWKFFR
jgi:uncharacterized membrane protein YdjX (TVP38/TMEM64 family)